MKSTWITAAFLAFLNHRLDLEHLLLLSWEQRTFLLWKYWKRQSIGHKVPINNVFESNSSLGVAMSNRYIIWNPLEQTLFSNLLLLCTGSTLSLSDPLHSKIYFASHESCFSLSSHGIHQNHKTCYMMELLINKGACITNEVQNISVML